MAMGRWVKIAGWLVLAAAGVMTVTRMVEVLSDASVAAYWPLILLESAVYGLVGVALVALGHWLARRDASAAGTGASSPDRKRLWLVRLFWGQSMVLLGCGLLMAAWFGVFILDTPNVDRMDDANDLLKLAGQIMAFSILPYWIGLRLKQGKGMVSAALYSLPSLLVFPIGTILGGLQLFLLRDLHRLNIEKGSIAG